VVYIRKYDTLSGSDSYLWATRLQLEEVPANVAIPSAWSDGSRQHIISTNNLGQYVAANAFTEVVTASDAGPGYYTGATHSVLLTTTYTPPVDCTITLFGTWSTSVDPTLADWYGPILQITTDADPSTSVALSAYLGASNVRVAQAAKLEYSAAAGVALRFRLLGLTGNIAKLGTAWDMKLRAEVIKR